jgi:succinate dehydrogenase / fumarate reductase cytochrome b subunit
VRDVRDALYVARNTDGKVVRRPMSPHLQIWRWPISMAVSICHRVTGVGLAIGTLLLTWWLVAAATSDSAFATVQWFLGSPIGLFVLFCWTLSLMLHFASGIRHLAWDAGWGFEPQTYRLTSRIVFIGGAAATLLIWIVGLAVW